ncbi:patatin-like phospholipase family protein [Curvibacter sp. HBC61]|uniref:Patatin-like phospholipase family protein n=1 Tax=Curvibacter cyanobacteriorum TaxID=3026422 RepID=A0ABT5N4I6_9BURK|nr:patatin-like phospholipase family protein [Curvibacter sp. HBC61]MDD0841055.1 patatin-like phospholipase family protein [Curvibacter sp. HBC61]
MTRPLPPTPGRRLALGAALAAGSQWLSPSAQAQTTTTPAAPVSGGPAPNKSHTASGRVQSAPPGGAPLRLGLALGGGSARGFSHIGVLKALDEAGYRADVVAGTSAGALVGAFYAAGFSPWQIEEVALKVRDLDVADLNSANKRGMFAGEALQRLVNEYLRQQPIERLRLPFCAVATQLASGEVAALRSGDTGLAVRASCAIPGVFVPAVVQGVELVDGGLVSPLPVRQARALGAQFVIALDVGAQPRNATGAGLYEVILQSFEIMGRAITQLEAQQADLLIRPDTARFSSTDFNARKELIQAGYEAGRASLAELARRLPGRARKT